MESVAVVAVPFPAQGHLNALLHLSLQLAARGVPVHYAAPVEHVRQARSRVHGWGDDTLRRVHFHELPISAYASPPPDPAAVSAFPSHLVPLWEAFVADAPAPLAALLSGVSASCRRVVVLYDVANGFAAEEAARLPNGEGYGLVCTAVSSIVGGTDAGKRLVRERGLDFNPVHSFVTEEFLAFVGERARWEQSIPCSVGILANTSRALEGEFIDVFTQQLAAAGKKLFAVGPLNPLLLDANSAPQQAGSNKERHECLDWLDEQPPASVLYVSFGSMSSLRDEQVEELAAALRDSKQRFIWVLRDADRANIFADHGESRHAKFLPEFAGHTQGRGMVITGWAPQLEILAHGATAAFLSHCGWNSTMESMGHGKPILAWPMHSDQPWDAELVCKHLKAGILVRPMEKQREVISAAAIQEAIEKMMVSDEGHKIQQRAMALGEAIRASSAAVGGGSENMDLDKFISHISR
jgi:cis-zeatin O-glucosyltransferase